MGSSRPMTEVARARTQVDAITASKYNASGANVKCLPMLCMEGVEIFVKKKIHTKIALFSITYYVDCMDVCSGRLAWTCTSTTVP